MKHMILQHLALKARGVLPALTVVAALFTATAHAAVPGISGAAGSPTFALTAHDSFLTQPDGAAIYSWGFGCASTSGNTFLPSGVPNASCPAMQVPGPTLIVNEGDAVTVKLTNSLPAVAGNTSILFPGFQVATTGGVPGLLAQEAVPGGSVTYTFTATTPGTHSYYSGTQGDLQVEMGMYGAVVVLPSKTATFSAVCGTGSFAGDVTEKAKSYHSETDFRLSTAAYDHPSTCYDREYLFQLAEMDPKIHQAAQLAVANATCAAGSCPPLNVPTEPYHPTYFMFNGRSMPDDMDPNYASEYPNQPYNANPHMHPGELVLLRIIGQGRWQHPFHEHGNHVRILARDGNLILSQTDNTKLAGPLMFTTTSTPGLAMDGIFYWTGKGLNWDVYGHKSTDAAPSGPSDANQANPSCMPDVNGYNTMGSAYEYTNFYEWCPDHNKPLEKAPFGDVGAGGPVTLPDPNFLTNGTWYGGSSYLGPEATARAVGTKGTTPPSGTVGNSPQTESGFAYMWHSHNEREITTNNLFPGGLMAMMLVDPWSFKIDESN